MKNVGGNSSVLNSKNSGPEIAVVFSDTVKQQLRDEILAMLKNEEGEEEIKIKGIRYILNNLSTKTIKGFNPKEKDFLKRIIKYQYSYASENKNYFLKGGNFSPKKYRDIFNLMYKVICKESFQRICGTFDIPNQDPEVLIQMFVCLIIQHDSFGDLEVDDNENMKKMRDIFNNAMKLVKWGVSPDDRGKVAKCLSK